MSTKKLRKTATRKRSVKNSGPSAVEATRGAVNGSIMPSSEPVRESPAPEPLHRGLDDPSHPAVDNEPVLGIDNIQGNILDGFNKDFQTRLFLNIDGPQVANFKSWLGSMAPFIATAAEVIVFNRLFKEIRTRRGSEPTGLKATWINIAGQIVGSYVANDQYHGFLWEKGTFITFDIPGVLSKRPGAINAAGQVVGAYDDRRGRQHGFLAKREKGDE